MKIISALILLWSALLLASCGQENAYILEPQWRDDIEYLVEIRPGAPTVGMNEFMIVATHKDHRPAHEAVISIKIKGKGDWRQSIQDGHSGVYRRAIRVNDPENDVMLVQVKQAKGVFVLSYPLTKKQ